MKLPKFKSPLSLIKDIFNRKEKKHREKLLKDYEEGRYLRFSTKDKLIDNRKIMFEGGK